MSMQCSLPCGLLLLTDTQSVPVGCKMSVGYKHCLQLVDIIAWPKYRLGDTYKPSVFSMSCNALWAYVTRGNFHHGHWQYLAQPQPTASRWLVLCKETVNMSLSGWQQQLHLLEVGSLGSRPALHCAHCTGQYLPFLSDLSQADRGSTHRLCFLRTKHRDICLSTHSSWTTTHWKLSCHHDANFATCESEVGIMMTLFQCSSQRTLK